MKKLSKEIRASRDEIMDNLQSTFLDLTDAVTKYNKAVEAERADLHTAIVHHNRQIDAARRWANDAAMEIREYMSERSEKWQETERGQAYEEWASSYESFAMDSLDIEMPEPIDDSQLDMADNPFEDLQEEIA